MVKGCGVGIQGFGFRVRGLGIRDTPSEAPRRGDAGTGPCRLHTKPSPKP